MLKLNRFSLLLVLSIAGASASAEEQLQSSSNVVALEVMGRTGFYSLSYERILSADLSAGVGFSFFPSDQERFSRHSWWRAPLYVNGYFLDAGNHRPYVTVGVSLAHSEVTYACFAVGAGYEYSAPSGFLFRAAPYVIFDDPVAMSVGLSLGTQF